LHWISNLLLQNKIVRLAEGGAGILAQNSLAKTGSTAWACLTHAHSLSSSEPICSVLVWLYDSARTYFIKNMINVFSSVPRVLKHLCAVAQSFLKEKVRGNAKRLKYHQMSRLGKMDSVLRN